MNETKETNRNSTRRNLVPIYIMAVLKECSNHEKHITQEFIRNRIADVYGYRADRKSLGRYVNLMLKEEELHVFGNASTGYWYDKDCYVYLE